MEDSVSRCPLIGQKIFNKLDNQDLTKVKILTKCLNHHLEKDKSFWKRVLQKCKWSHETFKDAWKLVTKKVRNEEMKELAIAVENFYSKHVQNVQIKFQFSP